jgi:uncharacterized linocin/CFP29 family protein
MTQTALQRAATFFDGEIVQPLRQTPMGRKLISVKPKAKGDGIKAADILKVIEMGEAQMAYKLPKEMSRDMIRIDKSTVNIPVLYKGYEVDRDAMNAYALQGVALDSAAAVSAAQVVGVMEDTAIIDGWKPQGTDYVMNGLYQSAGISYDTTQSFGTYGKAKTAVTGLMALLEAVHVYPPFNLTLNPTQHGELVMSESTAGIEEYPRIIRIINGNVEGGPGRIFSSSDMAAGKGMLTPVDPARVYMELLNPQPVRNVLGEDSKMPGISDITGTTFEAIYVHVKQANALGKLTDI